MAIPCSTLIKPCPESSIQRSSFVRSNAHVISPNISTSYFPVAANCFPSAFNSRFKLHNGAASFNGGFCGLKFWILQKLKFQKPIRKLKWDKMSNGLEIQGRDGQLEKPLSSEEKISEHVSAANTAAVGLTSSSSSLPKMSSIEYDGQSGRIPSLCIAVIGATGELARNKIFPALFALYYSGFLPENVGIFGYSRKDITDEDLRSTIAATLTCRVDHQENCGDKLHDFLNRTYYINGGYNNKEGMAKLNSRMDQIEGISLANRIFYLSVPQEALPDVASCLADNAQTQKGWNRIIIEKPFGFDAVSSYQFTQTLLAKFDEKQIYRIDHLLGKDTIENLTVLRFSNSVFEPLWSRTYIRNVQVVLSEEWGIETRGRYFEGYGIIRDIVHSHILQTIALFAMEPPVSLDGEDIRNEKVKVLRSIRKLELDDVVLGQYKGNSDYMDDVYLNSLTPTFFVAALYVDNPRWDGVPFLIKAGMGLIKHRYPTDPFFFKLATCRVEIRIQFHHVPGNLYRERIGQNIDLATNELILRDAPEEAILLKVNNKVPGLALQLDASELNLLYRDKYNVDIPDSYEHLLLDVINGDNHLFMRSDELAAAWNILSPVLQEMDKGKIAPELYQFGGRGPIGAYYLGAKHGVRWADD